MLTVCASPTSAHARILFSRTSLAPSVSLASHVSPACASNKIASHGKWCVPAQLALMHDASGTDPQGWSGGFEDVPFDEASDLLFNVPFSFADEPRLLDPLSHQEAVSSDPCRSQLAPEAVPLPVAPIPPQTKAETVGKAAARLEKKAEQNRCEGLAVAPVGCAGGAHQVVIDTPTADLSHRPVSHFCAVA